MTHIYWDVHQWVSGDTKYAIWLFIIIIIIIINIIKIIIIIISGSSISSSSSSSIVIVIIIIIIIIIIIVFLSHSIMIISGNLKLPWLCWSYEKMDRAPLQYTHKSTGNISVFAYLDARWISSDTCRHLHFVYERVCFKDT